MKIKLAEALLRRKELNEKVDQLRKINVEGLFDVRVKRMNVTDSVDDVTAKVPKITLAQVTAGYDYYAKQLRLIDAKIQQANWITEIEITGDTMKDFVEPEKK
ncbi:hypothetical protein ES703_61300 [subsurface metagenome]